MTTPRPIPNLAQAIERPEFLDGCIVRHARKTWRCQARQARFDPVTLRRTTELLVDHEPTCPVVIPRGSRYVEDLNEGSPYGSGRRYSLACAEAKLQSRAHEQERAR